MPSGPIIQVAPDDPLVSPAPCWVCGLPRADLHCVEWDTPIHRGECLRIFAATPEGKLTPGIAKALEDYAPVSKYDTLSHLRWQRDALQRRCGELLERARGLRYMVASFHHKYGHPVAARPHVPEDQVVRFRLRLITEEYLEFLDSSLDLSSRHNSVAVLREVLRNLIDGEPGGNPPAPVDVDLLEFVDALGDMDYINEGTRLVFGVNGRPVAEEIQRANMSKEPNGPDGKPVKPEGWTPPDIAGVLEEQGWER